MNGFADVVRKEIKHLFRDRMTLRIALLVLVQLLQSFGDWLVRKVSHR